MKPYIYSAIIGNGRVLASLGANGELHRLFWPHIDSPQHIGSTWAALLSPAMGDRAVRLEDEGTWAHCQEYVSDTNILKTICADKYNRFQVTAVDYVTPDRDIVVRYYEVSNISDKPLPAVLVYFSNMYLDSSSIYNSNYYDQDADVMFHHRRDIWVGVAGHQVPGAFQSGCGSETAYYGNLNGNRVALAPDACQTWDLGEIPPGGSKTMVLYLALGHNREEVLENVFYARQQGWDRLFKQTAEFWQDYLKKALPLPGADETVTRLFSQSIMVSKLLMNRETGGIIAAPEFDETWKCCGGYAFCWPRDGVIIAHGMLKAGYPEYARDFYRWAARYQNQDGSWPQRQFTTGELAPRWGDQIDETGSVLWGIAQYAKQTWDWEFLEEVWPAVAKAANFLLSFLDEETGLPGMSWDLWEERYGQHAYSCAAVYAGLKGAGQAARKLNYTEQAEKWLDSAAAIKDKLSKYFLDEESQRFMRSGWLAVSWNIYEERKLACRQVREVIEPTGHTAHHVFGEGSADASLLGLTVPFAVIPAEDIRMQNTVRHIKETLTNNNTGGIHRYQDDGYIGGNPWVLTTLWMGMFECASGDLAKARERLSWAGEHQTSLGFLPEQVDAETGRPAWVVPLAWSHAMYLLLAAMISSADGFAS